MTMTDDTRSIVRAFGDAQAMTLEAIIMLTGLSEHSARFILEQLRQAGLAQETHGRWYLTEAASIIRESALHVFNFEK